MKSCCPVVELRQYTLHPGQRDVLVELFEREFLDTQEAVGAHVMGVFHDLDDPDRFVWLRGFAGMEARAAALAAFYDGAVWKAHRQSANATILDSDNVLLLRPSGESPGFEVGGRAAAQPAGVVTAMIHYLTPVLLPAFAAFFDAHMRPILEARGAEVLAGLVTETRPDDFGRLPIREEEHVFVWFARFASEALQEAFAMNCRSQAEWREKAPEALLPAFMRKPEPLRLAPTDRSLLR